MSQRRTRRGEVEPLVDDIESVDVERLLERGKAALGPEDYACLEKLIQSHGELQRLIRERGTTIAWLRRLLGQSNSEKTADVLPNDEPTSEAQSPGDAGPQSNDDTSATEPDGDAPVAGDAEPRKGDDGDESGRRRKGHGRIGAAGYRNATHVVVPHDTLRIGCGCPGCQRGRLYPLPPSSIVRIVGQAPLVATSWYCERLRCSGCGQVFTAIAPPAAQGPKYSETAVAMMVLLRYGTGLPLHRLDRLQRSLGVPLPASTQWQVASEHVDAVRPVYEEFLRLAANASVIHNDDTTARVLEFMGKRRAELLTQGEFEDPDRTGLFTTGVVAQTNQGVIALFFTGRKHAGENLADLLARRDPNLAPPIHMCDGLGHNRPEDHTVVEAACLVHGRRHFVDEKDNFPVHCRHLLEQLRIVFKNEADSVEQGLSAEQRLEFHQEHSATTMSDLKLWLEAQLDQHLVEPNSGLGQACKYLLKRWNQLTVFLRVPGAPIDNNICERALKMAIRHRNNSLFYRSARGARVGDICMALIHTAKLHDENPFEYVTALLQHRDQVAAKPSAWLPWNFRDALAEAARTRQRAA